MAIVVTDIIKSFGNPPQQIIRNVSFIIENKEFVSITGRSGSGKSTLLYIISSLDKTTSGKIEIDGQDLSTLSDAEMHHFRNEKMGFIFQSHYLLPELTSLENVLMPARRTRTELKRRQKGIELLISFGLESKLNHLPGQLSGGEQQRVAIARALIMDPIYLFADEPTGNLDSTSGDNVLSIIKVAPKKTGTSVVMVTHDADYAALADRSLQMVDGRLSEKSSK